MGKQLRPVIERGIVRGDLRPDTNFRLVHELLIGPILYRLLLSGPPLDRKLTLSLADAVLESFSPDGRARSAPSGRRRQK